jgi:hypothetical protein
MQKAAYTIHETMSELGIGRTKLYQLIKEGRIIIHKIDKRTIVKAKSVRDFLDSLPEVHV